ncbi:hypothetical protein [Streptomyces sp. NPDC046759]|uniref:hypothetical protein n=1 Tax=Streptomyces sp. NPDC046759 TaxID=3155019 RepID=UPI0033FD576B
MPPPPQQPYPNGAQPPSPYGPQPPQAPGPYGPQPPQASGPYGPQPSQAPGPYDPQPSQAPGPYDPQPSQAPGPYGSPYPPQPQPYPPHPYGQEPYPAWGAPPLAPLPKKRRIGLILAVVGGAVVAVVVVLALIGVAMSSGFPAATNKLVLPKALLDGKYQLAQDLTDSEGKKVEKEADGAWDAKDIHAVTARYSPGGDSTKGMLLVSGMYGRFKNKDLVRANMLKGATEADSVTVDEPAKDVTPAGSDVTISCEVLTQKASVLTITYPVCAWADGNTAAVIGEAALPAPDPSDVDLDAAARHTVKVRSEMLRPVG